MNQKAVLKVVCLTAIGAPPILAATQGLAIPPLASALMAILALAAGYTLSELEPGFRRSRPVHAHEPVPDLTLADEIMLLTPAERVELRGEIEHRRVLDSLADEDAP